LPLTRCTCTQASKIGSSTAQREGEGEGEEVYNEFKEHGKKSNFKIIKVMKSMVKARFSHYLLRNIFTNKL
jgi:hypothetical protein